jgi:hypothetical protein
VDIGAERIDNGEMIVSEDLYKFALDKKTRDPSPVSIQNLVMNFGEALVESHKKNRIIEGVASESPA